LFCIKRDEKEEEDEEEEKRINKDDLFY